MESHPIILSPMSRTQSAVVAPPTPQSPPADGQLPPTAEEQHNEVATEQREQSHQESAGIMAPADAPPQPAADYGTENGHHGDATATDAHDTTESAGPPLATDAPTQVPGDEAAAEPAQQGGDDEAADADDSESDPSTPVAVREALAAVHSLAISTGVRPSLED